MLLDLWVVQGEKVAMVLIDLGALNEATVFELKLSHERQCVVARLNVKVFLRSNLINYRWCLFLV